MHASLMECMGGVSDWSTSGFFLRYKAAFDWSYCSSNCRGLIGIRCWRWVAGFAEAAFVKAAARWTGDGA